MKKFRVEDPFWDLFPEARIGVVVCRGVDNTDPDREKYANIIASAQIEAMKYLPDPEFSQNEVVQVWREAFQQFKTKKGARSSVEALLKRAQKGNPLNPINPLVDLYNAISLWYALPCGGEDIDTFEGDLRLTLAHGDEAFVTLGTEISEPPFPGEVVYKDDAGAVCRCLNWREAVRTMLTEHTQNAFLCLEMVDGKRLDDLTDAVESLAAQVSFHLGGQCQTAILDVKNPEIEIDPSHYPKMEP